MAGNAVIGALRVVLGADTASLEKGLKGASSSLDAFASKAKIAGAAIAGAMTAAVAGLGFAIKGAVNEADKMGKMAQSFGVPVEELSRLKHAADLSDVSIESLGTAMGRLSRNMSDVAAGASNEAANAFKALGVDVTNAGGGLRSASEVMADVAAKFAGMEDGAQKTAFAIQLFGRSGADLIPMLNAGKTGLQEMAAEADALGIVIDTKTAKAAEAFNDNLTRLGKVKDGIIQQITARLLPTLESLSQKFLDFARNETVMKTAALGIENAIKGIVITAMAASTVMQRFAAELSAFWKVVTAPDWSSMKAAWAEFRAEGDKTEQHLAGLRQRIAAIWNNTPDFPIQFDLNALALVNEQVNQIGMSFLRMIAQATQSSDTATQATKKLKDETEKAGRSLSQVDPIARGVGNALESTFSRAIDGGQTFGELLQGLTKDLMRMAASTAFRAILGGGMGGGGGIFGALFNAAPPFANGGSFTVGGAGGIDSKLAMMRVTPGERVTVSKKGQGMGGGFTYAPSYHFDAGIGPADMTLIQTQIAASEARTRSDVTNIVAGRLYNDPTALGGA